MFAAKLTLNKTMHLTNPSSACKSFYIATVNSKHTGTTTPMIAAYDWVKPARDKNNIQKESGEFSGASYRQESFSS